MQTRRLVAAGVIVIIVIALALLVKGCDNSATNSALKNYNASVYSLINASDSNGANVFKALTNGSPSSTRTSQALATAVQTAESEQRQAAGYHPPSQMADAQTALTQVMQLRADGISTIAAKAAQAANQNTSKDAVYNISVGMSQLYTSDVLYKTFVATDIAKALNAAGISVGTSAGEQQINPGQILSDLGWLQSSWIASKIGAQETTAQANANNVQPGNHGHRLNYVTVDGTEIYPTSTSTIPVSQSQTWTLNLTNDGTFPEYHVGCIVRVEGLSDTGTSYIAETRPGETTDCVVHLPASPTPGTYSVIAKVAGVPVENDFKNNTFTYSVTFN